MAVPWEKYQPAKQADGPWSKYNPSAADKAPEEKGFFGRLGDDLNNRYQRAQEAKAAEQMGQQSGLETKAQNAISAGNFLLGDIPTEVLKSGWDYLPEQVQQPIKEVATNAISAIANTHIGDNPSVGQIVAGADEAYNQFKENNPRAGRNTDALLGAGNIALAFTPVKGKSAVGATSDALGNAAKAGGKVASGIGRAVKAAGEAVVPGIDDGLLDVAVKAKQYNIPLSLDQVANSKPLKTLQKVGQEAPFSGYSAFRDKQMRAFNKALFKTVGVDADMFTPKTMDIAFSKVGGEFDSLTNGKNFNIGNDFINNAAAAADDIETAFGAEAAAAFRKETEKVLADFQNGDSIPGELLGRQRARINALARKAKPGNKEALLELEGLLVDGITGENPAAEAALSQAKQRYKNLLALEPLTVKAKSGKISPSLLNDRVARIYGRSYTRGQAGEIGDLAKIGYEILPELGGSDTAQKVATLAVMANPYTAVPAAGGAVVNRLFQSGINRNQGIINSALLKEIAKLPPKEAEEALKRIRAQ